MLGGIAIAIVALGTTAWAGWVSNSVLNIPTIQDRVQDVREVVQRMDGKIDMLLSDRVEHKP